MGMNKRGIECAYSTKADQLAELLPLLQHTWTSRVVALLHRLWVWVVRIVHDPDVWRRDSQQRTVGRVLVWTSLLILAFQFSTNRRIVAAQRALIASLMGLWADREEDVLGWPLEAGLT